MVVYTIDSYVNTYQTHGTTHTSEQLWHMQHIYQHTYRHTKLTHVPSHVQDKANTHSTHIPTHIKQRAHIRTNTHPTQQNMAVSSHVHEEIMFYVRMRRIINRWMIWKISHHPDAYTRHAHLVQKVLVLTNILERFPLTMLHPRNPSNRKTQISWYKFTPNVSFKFVTPDLVKI